MIPWGGSAGVIAFRILNRPMSAITGFRRLADRNVFRTVNADGPIAGVNGHPDFFGKGLILVINRLLLSR